METIEVTRSAWLATVTLNRPERHNAVSLAMWQRLPGIFADLDRDTRLRAILLTGAGASFSAGADITEFDQVRSTVDEAIAYEAEVDRCGDAITAVSKPTIAVINGYCMGGACHLAMSCDFRYAAHDARFAIPAAHLSIVYGVRATRKLLSLVGLAEAKRILYSGMRFGANEAQQVGLVDHLSDEPAAAAHDYARQLAENAPLSIAGAKAILNGLASSWGGLPAAEAEAVIQRAIESQDYQEGRRAFAEKRQPEFRGY